MVLASIVMLKACGGIWSKPKCRTAKAQNLSGTVGGWLCRMLMCVMATAPCFSAYVLQVLSYVFVPAGVVYIALMNLGNMGWCMRQLMLIGLSPYELM